MKSIINKIIAFFKKLRGRYHIARAYLKMKKAYNVQLAARKNLRKDVNLFLKEFFGINKNSKYIPKDFKNSEEVRVAVEGKFQDRMDDLNVKFADLFK